MLEAHHPRSAAKPYFMPDSLRKAIGVTNAASKTAADVAEEESDPGAPGERKKSKSAHMDSSDVEII